jgi:hypothetical protein
MKTKIEDFILGTRIGYLLFFGVIGVCIWAIIAFICSLFLSTFFHFLPFFAGYMAVGILNAIFLYRDLPWFNHKN